MTHILKTWPAYFDAVWEGNKTFEIRRNDRNFTVGDTLHLLEYDNFKETYSCRYVRGMISYITDWEQKPGNVVMAFSMITKGTIAAQPEEGAGV